MVLKSFKKKPLIWLVVGGALLLLVAGLAWCFKVNMDPERVFWSTIERGLSTHGVTVQSEQESAGTTAEQTIRYSLGADNLSHSLTSLTQGNTTVVNETIGTPTMDYTRYLDIKTDQAKADGSDIDFSELLGVWAEGQSGPGQFFNQAVFGAALPVGGMGVPVGNVAPASRAELMQQIRNNMVYQIPFDKTKKEHVNGRLHYTYDATVQPAAYVALMKKFSQNIGLHGLDQVDPDNYKGQKPFELQITVDAYARQVVRITALDGGGTQTYASYDVPVQIEVPNQAISGAELRQILSNLQ